jgi:YHS domain-containing protein/thiol-disulfide isomerase/thioredoxin
MRATFCLCACAIGLALTSNVATARDNVPWAPSLEAAQQVAAQRQQLILIHFYGDNCPPCEALEANVFPRPEFGKGVAANYVPVKINASQNKALAQKYGVDRWPADVIANADGTPITRATVSPQDPAKYLAGLDQFAVAHRARQAASAQVAANVGYNQPSTAGRNVAAPPAGAPIDPRLAAAPPQPQPSGYDPRGYQPRGQDGPDRTSSFRPAGEGFAQNGPPSQANDSIYGGSRDVRLNNSQANAGQQPPVVQPMSPPNPQWQTNPTIGASPNGQPDPRSIARAPAEAAPAAPLAMDGYCPVALAEATKWIKGDVRFGAIHRGRTYLFGTQADQQKFLMNPDKYSPMLSGFDAVKYLEQGVLVDGNRKHGCVLEGQLYLFADLAALEKFEKSPGNYTSPVRQAMQQSVTPKNYR